MANNINFVLNGGSIQSITTNDSAQRVLSLIGNIILPANEMQYIDFLPIAAGAGTVLQLPAATIFALAVQNIGGLNGTPAGNLAVQVQPLGGALPSVANSPLVLVGGVYIYWQAQETAGGLTAVTIAASIANTPARIAMAA